MAIHEIKTTKAKSHSEIMSTLRDALKEAKDTEYSSIAIIMCTSDMEATHYIECGIAGNGDYGQIISLMEDLKLRILMASYEQD